MKTETITKDTHRTVSREKLFHVWQIANSPEFEKHWGYLAICKRFVTAYDSYDETAENQKEQLAGLVEIARAIIADKGNVELVPEEMTA
jgi:hypothetical protein